jgi:hypothetical protein
MERSVALKKLGKLLGKSMGYRVDPKAPDAEEREEAGVELKAVVEARTEAQLKMDARRREILAADAEYQALKASYDETRKRAERLQGMSHHYRFTVGVSNGMFFMIKAQGDSWEEVIATVAKDRQPA